MERRFWNMKPKAWLRYCGHPWQRRLNATKFMQRMRKLNR